MQAIIRVVQVAPENYALRLALYDDNPHAPVEARIDADSAALTELAQGYRTPHQALAALVECLTFAPPDMGVYDDAVNRISQLVDGQTNVEDAIQQLNARLQAAEDLLQVLQTGGRPATSTNPLLARRPTAPSSVAAPPAAPPPIRRPRVSIGMQSHAGGIQGGVARRGQAETADEGDGE